GGGGGGGCGGGGGGGGGGGWGGGGGGGGGGVCVGGMAVPVLVLWVVMKYGGFSFIKSEWAGTGFMTKGIADGSLSFFSLEYPSVLTFTILYGCFIVWGNIYYSLRVSCS